MIGDALRYPTNDDDWIKTAGIGGALVLVGSILFIPMIFVQGFFFRVARGVALGNEMPPKFDDWEGIAIDGLKVLAVTMVYSMVLTVVMTIGFFAFGAVILGGMAGGETGLLAGGLIAVVGILVVTVVSLAIGYLMPAAVVNMAIEDSIGAAFDFSTLTDVALSVEYLVAWLLASLVGVGVALVGGPLVFLLIGFPILFYGQTVSWYLFARGFADAGGVPRAAGTPTGTPAEAAPVDREW